MHIGIVSLLTILFITLKLVGTISWHWFWVLSPLIFGAALWVLLIVLAIVLSFAVALWKT